MSPLLLAGLVMLFGGLTCLGLAIAQSLPGRDRGVARSLEAVRAMNATGMLPRDVRQAELDRPFVDRVVDPVIAWFVTLGRRLTGESRIIVLRRRLLLAGNPPGWSVDRVLGVKALAAVTGGIIRIVLQPVLGTGLLLSLLTFIVVVVCGWVAPNVWLRNKASARSRRVRRDLPDALDLLTISVESGLAFDAALSQVARNMDGPLAAEFARVLQEMQIGTGRMDAMRALAARTDVEELRSFVGAMVQADSFGISVSGVLRVQAKEMRVKRSQRAEEEAQKIPLKMIFPMILCILPCLFLVVMGPAAITAYQNFTRR